MCLAFYFGAIKPSLQEARPTSKREFAPAPEYSPPLPMPMPRNYK